MAFNDWVGLGWVGLCWIVLGGEGGQYWSSVPLRRPHCRDSLPEGMPQPAGAWHRPSWRGRWRSGWRWRARSWRSPPQRRSCGWRSCGRRSSTRCRWSACCCTASAAAAAWLRSAPHGQGCPGTPEPRKLSPLPPPGCPVQPCSQLTQRQKENIASVHALIQGEGQGGASAISQPPRQCKTAASPCSHGCCLLFSLPPVVLIALPLRTSPMRLCMQF